MNSKFLLRLSHLALIVIGVITTMQNIALARSISTGPNESVTFNPVLLVPGLSQSNDLTRFEKGAAILPGDYSVDFFVNNKPLGKNNVSFRSDSSSDNVSLCMTPKAISKINFNYRELKQSTRDILAQNSDTCYEIDVLFPEVKYDFDSGNQRLELTIPQAYLRNTDNGYVEPEAWDKGINALIFGYQSNYYTMSSRGTQSDSFYTGLNSGFNLGLWQLRHNGSYSWQNDVGGHYQRINTYVQRDLPSISSRIILGENHTSGQVFDSAPFRGIRISDVDKMLPQSERGYAPEIRGIARTNAKVTIRQNGQILRETTVVPGAFNINDLYPTGYGGDLDVTVTESDGSVQTYSVPYSAVEQLLRPGAFHYDIIAGEYNYSNFDKRRAFYQGTLQYGINNTVTGYGGIQSSNDDYYAIQGGAALNTPLGALAFDISHAQTRFDNSAYNTSGQSYRASFSKRLPETKSSVSVAAYRYSTSGYLDLGTAMNMMNEMDNGRNPDNFFRPKNRFSTTISQGLPDGFGQMYLTGYTQNYWNSGSGSDLQYQLGYNNNVGRVTFGLNAGRTRNYYGHMESTAMINMSIPIGNTTTMAASLSRDNAGHLGQQVSLSGTAGRENEFGYGISGAHYDNGSGTSGSLSGSYRSPYSNLSGTFGSGKNYTSASAGASGTILAYSGGAVMTPYTSDTFAIVEAKGAKGASVGNYTGVKIDSFGHAAVPYLNSYQMNEISIDPKGVGQNIEFQNTTQSVSPYSGAVVKLDYETSQAIPLMLTLSGDHKIPFGATVTDSHGNNVGVVGQGGQAYTRVSSAKDTLNVRWGRRTNEICQINYSLSQHEISSKNTISRSALCSLK